MDKIRTVTISNRNPDTLERIDDCDMIWCSLPGHPPHLPVTRDDLHEWLYWMDSCNITHVNWDLDQSGVQGDYIDGIGTVAGWVAWTMNVIND